MKKAKDINFRNILTFESYRQVPGKIAGCTCTMHRAALHRTGASAQHTSGWYILAATQERVQKVAETV